MDLQAEIDSLKGAIRDVPDFPKKGIVFKDITTLLKDPVTFRRAVDLFVVLCGGERVDKVVAIESRGFILGSLVANRLGVGFVPVRKPGKLPARTMKATYELEYGTDSLEIHEDAVSAGGRVLLVRRLISTCGNGQAVGDLTKKLSATLAGYPVSVQPALL